MKRLISAPITRKLKNIVDIENITLITHIKHDLKIPTIDYPSALTSRIQKFLFKIKKVLDLYFRYKFHANLLTNNEKIIVIFSFIFINFRSFLDRLIIFCFKNKTYDKIVYNFDIIEIYTFNMITELFLYSSANRLNKHLIFCSDGWDVYSSKYIPLNVNEYKIWGEFDLYYLKLYVKRFSFYYQRNVYKRYNKSSKANKIIVYEGTVNEVPKKLQVEVISTLIEYSKNRSLIVVFKKLYKDITVFSDHELRDLNCEIFHSSIEFSDLGSVFSSEQDDLAELVPDAKIFVGFNSTHGLLEFGLNRTKLLCISSILGYTNCQLLNYLKICGVVVLDSNKDKIYFDLIDKLPIDYDFKNIINY